LTKNYDPHKTLYYKMTPCEGEGYLYSNSDLMYNLYAYIGNYSTFYDDDLNYLGCYLIGLDLFDPAADYQHYYLSSGYTPNLVNVFPDCGCTGRTDFDVVQEEPGIPRFYAYDAEVCGFTGGTPVTVYSSNPYLLTGYSNTYKISIPTGVPGEPDFVLGCYTNFIRRPYPAYDYFYQFEHFNSCEECEYVPPTPTPTNTPTVSMTPSNTPTISLTPSITPSPIITNVYCYEGVYELDDPAHPFGGVVNYIDQYGNFQTQQYIWLGDFITIVAQSIISTTGVVTVICPSPTPTPNATPTPTPTRTSGNGIWTVSNYDCGFGTVNDVGINGSFMGSLPLGPSTFPLTSTLGGSRQYPSGVVNGSNTIQANVTTNIQGTGNCLAMYIYVNQTSVPDYEGYWNYSNPFPQISGVNLTTSDDVWVVIQCYVGACP
jgi:hypothetical protein